MWKVIALTLGLAVIVMGVDKGFAQPFSLQVNPNAADAYREPSNLELMNAVRELSAHSTRLEMLLTLHRAALNDMKEQLDQNDINVRDIHGRLAHTCRIIRTILENPWSSQCVADWWDSVSSTRIDFATPYYSAEQRPLPLEMVGP